MLSIMVRGGPIHLFVADTGELIGEVLHGVRRNRATALLLACHLGSARLFVARHVLEEVERHLPERCAHSGVALPPTLSRWEDVYLPHIYVVDVPTGWANDDPRVHAVQRRHAADTPTARLMVTLGPCHGLADDHDLTDHNLGQREWLVLAHAGADRGLFDVEASAACLACAVATELTKAIGDLLRAVPREVWLLLIGIGVGLFLASREVGKKLCFTKGTSETAHRIADVIAPILHCELERFIDAEATLARTGVEPTPSPSLGERMARALAVSPGPLTAGELARKVDGSGTIKSRVAAIGDELDSCSAFVEVNRGRWQLGSLADEGNGELAAELVSRAFARRVRGHGDPSAVEQYEMAGSEMMLPRHGRP